MILKQEHNNMGLITLEKGKQKFLHVVQSHLNWEVFFTVVNGHTWGQIEKPPIIERGDTKSF